MLGYIIAQALYTQNPTSRVSRNELSKKIMISENLDSSTSKNFHYHYFTFHVCIADKAIYKNTIYLPRLHKGK